jgi:hypothetical protein
VRYLSVPSVTRVRNVARAFVFHSTVMPAIGSFEAPENTQARAMGLPFLSVQEAPLGSSGGFGILATAAWAMLLLAGGYAALSRRTEARFTIVVATAILGQLCLHTIYGEETFLYALNYWPLLLIVAPMGTFTPARPAVLGLVALCAAASAVNNLAQFGQVSAGYERVGKPADGLAATEGLQRTHDHWNTGHAGDVLVVEGHSELFLERDAQVHVAQRVPSLDRFLGRIQGDCIFWQLEDSRHYTHDTLCVHDPTPVNAMNSTLGLPR